MKTQNSGDSYNSNEIDLDDIAKMIEPLDDLENELFFKPKTSTSRNAQTIPPKKNPLRKGKSEDLGDDEGEILTSMSSNNGPSKSTASGKSLQKTQPTDLGIEATVDKGDNINVSSMARRRNSKLGGEVERSSGMSKIFDDNKLTRSNMSTGLWSGDDLWKLDGNAVTNSMPSKSNPMTSNAKSNSIRDSSGNATHQSPHKTNTLVQGNKKAGKFDWLGLLGEESEEEKDKGLSHASKDQANGSKDKSSTDKKTLPHEKSNSLNVNSPNHYGGRRFFEPSNGSNENEFSATTPELRGKSGGSISDSLKLSGNRVSVKNSESELSRLKKITPGPKRKEAAAEDEYLASKIPDPERDTVVHSGTNAAWPKAKEGIMSNDKKDKLSGSDELPPAGPVITSRKSILGESERSDRGYAPTFSGGLSDSSGRRRRRREGPERPSGLSKGPNFDPLGLFSLDDANEPTPSKMDKPLPDWLTGSTKKSEMTKEEVSKSSENEGALVPGEGSKSSNNAVEKELSSGNSEDMKMSKDPPKVLAEQEESPKSHENEESSRKMDKVGPSHVKSKVNEQQEENSKHKGTMLKTSESVKEDKRKKYAGSGESFEPSAHDYESPMKRVVKQSSSPSTESDKSENHDITSEELAVKMNKRSTNRNSRKKSPPKLKTKKKEKQKDYASDEDVSSTVGKVDSKRGNKRRLSMVEKHYTRRIQEMEKHLVRVEQLEEDLGRMRYLQGEVEHLKAVIHLLQTEKSTAEALVDSLQSKHEEQLKRLNEIHANEIESLSMALLREKKRGAEEVRQLAEDHRKTLERLMEANVRLEEQFKNRMLEARNDWSRDIEALRQAYQQSNSAAITNASLAVLTGHGFGTSEAKEKNAAEKRDEVKSVPLCPPEVKELSQAVERVESILTQALDSVLPKVNSLRGGSHQNEAELKDKGPASSNLKKRRSQMVGRKKRRLHKRRPFVRIRGDVEDEASEGRGGEHMNSKATAAYSDGEESDEQVAQRTGVSNNARDNTQTNKGKQKEKRSLGACKYCDRCLTCSSPHVNALDSHHCSEKCEKEGRNHHFHYSNKEDWREDKKIFAWDDRLERGNGYRTSNDSWGLKEHEMRGDTNEILRPRQEFKPYPSYFRQSNDIIDPKQYLKWLASGNIDNLFQPSGVSYD